MAYRATSSKIDPLATTTIMRRYRQHSTGGATPVDVPVEHFDLAKVDPQRMAVMCGDPSGLRAAVHVRNKIPNDLFLGTKEAAIYIVKSQDCTKVGLSNNPLRRIKAMQTANPRGLSLAALFWIVDGEPRTFEKAAHDRAKRDGIRLIGEWLGCDAPTAALLTAETLFEKGAKVADSNMWVRQREAIWRSAFDDDFEDYDDPDYTDFWN